MQSNTDNKTQALPYRIMLVEDDLHQQQSIIKALKLQNPELVIDAFSEFEQARQALIAETPDLLLSDIMLGAHQDGGFELAKIIQQGSHKPIPVLFFSERQSEFDILTGHDLGAVDYLPKPISLMVLQRKVSNLLKLISHNNATKPDATRIANLKIDPQNFKAYWHEKPLQLTITEFEMIAQFSITSIGQLVSYQDLQAATQGVVERNTINTHICRIRQAFKQITPDFDAIQNVYGRGYTWHEHV